MNQPYLTAFLIGYSLMFTIHFMAEPTWRPGEPRSTSIRMIVNYTIGTLGIWIAFLSMHRELWLDVLVCIAGAGSATVLAHSRDWLLTLVKRDRANGLIENSQEQP